MDLKEINETLYPHNVRFLIDKKPYYFNVLNIPFDKEINNIELQYNNETVIDIIISWNDKLILRHKNVNKIGFKHQETDHEGKVHNITLTPSEFFKDYLTMQHFLNMLASPILPNLLKELYNIHTELDSKVYKSNWSTELFLNQP